MQDAVEVMERAGISDFSIEEPGRVVHLPRDYWQMERIQRMAQELEGWDVWYDLTIKEGAE